MSTPELELPLGRIGRLPIPFRDEDFQHPRRIFPARPPVTGSPDGLPGEGHNVIHRVGFSDPSRCVKGAVA